MILNKNTNNDKISTYERIWQCKCCGYDFIKEEFKYCPVCREPIKWED